MARIFHRNEFVPDRHSAKSAGVVVFFALGQDEKKALANPHGPFASGAVQLGGVEVPVTFPFHRFLSLSPSLDGRGKGRVVFPPHLYPLPPGERKE
jgi:hypothetical protein